MHWNNRQIKKRGHNAITRHFPIVQQSSPRQIRRKAPVPTKKPKKKQGTLDGFISVTKQAQPTQSTGPLFSTMKQKWFKQPQFITPTKDQQQYCDKVCPPE